MKLIIQVPCLNEEKTLPLVMSSMPKSIKGVDKIETMIIDDGSTDKTIAVAQALGVDHIIRHKTNKGLATSFSDGIHACLRLGADIIVNTDGDNQYNQADIPKLQEWVKSQAKFQVAGVCTHLAFGEDAAKADGPN